MGRTHRKRKKRQLPKEPKDFRKVINLQKSLRVKCPNIKIDYFDGIGWGVRCKKNIDEGEIIISLPLSQLITPDVQCEIFSLINAENQSPQFVLSIFLMYELHLRQKSKYYDYIQSLPNSFTNLYFCTKKEEELLPNFLKQELFSQTSVINKFWDELLRSINDKLCPHCGKNLRNICSRNTFIWAWFIVNTRSVYYENEEHKKSLALAPFLDMFNHSDGAITQMSINFKEGLYILKTLVKYKKFEQVFIKYGDHSNLKLLLEYGFILPNNTNDCVEFNFQEIVNIVKELYPECGQITRPKYNFIKTNRLNQHLSKNTEFSWNFKGLISVLTSADQNLFFTLQSKVFSDEFTTHEINKVKKISETVLDRKGKELEQNLLKMEQIEKCTESFQLAKTIIKIHISFLS